MTATKDIATKLEAWAASVTQPVLNTYPENPEDLVKALPLVVCDIERKRKVAAEGGMAQYQHEQRDLRVWVARLTVMVATDPSWDRTRELYDLTDQMETALTRDKTLGGRVEAAAPRVEVEFPGELEHPSGLVALGAFFSVTVGESAEV